MNSTNNTLVKCATCRGTKKIKGMGNIEKNCPTCHGIGYIENEPKKDENIIKIKKKPGRKKRDELQV